MKTASPEIDFKTTDLYFAAYLQSAGVQMLRYDRVGKQLTFVFDNKLSDVKQLQMDYFANKAKIPALAFTNALKSLKNLCHMSG